LGITRVQKREAQLKLHLFHEISLYGKTLEVTSIQDVRKPGTPDFTLSGHGKTHWWELKHGTPNFTTYELQEIKCCRLARTSFCRYLIYVDEPGKRYALVLHPQLVFEKGGKLADIDVSQADYRVDDHNHGLLAHYMRTLLHEHID